MRSFVYIILLALTLFANISFASNLTPEQIEQKKLEIYKQDMAKISDYLNDIKTLVSPFDQRNAEGEVSSGTFYLSRPGSLRWEYDPPTPILIVAKGSLLTYYDSSLEQISHIGLDDSLAGFLTKKNISFEDESIEVIRFDKTKEFTAITIIQAGKEDEGKLTLIFDREPIKLSKMVVLDALGVETEIFFNDVIYNVTLGDELFKTPKIKKNKIR